MEEIVTSVQTEAPKVESKPDAPLTKVVSHNSLYELFNVDKSPRNDEALAKIWKWAEEVSPNKDLDSIKMTIISKRNRMQSSPIGELPYLRMEIFVSAYYDMKRAESKMAEMTGGNFG